MTRMEPASQPASTLDEAAYGAPGGDALSQSWPPADGRSGAPQAPTHPCDPTLVLSPNGSVLGEGLADAWMLPVGGTEDGGFSLALDGVASALQPTGSQSTALVDAASPHALVDQHSSACSSLQLWGGAVSLERDIVVGPQPDAPSQLERQLLLEVAQRRRRKQEAQPLSVPAAHASGSRGSSLLEVAGGYALLLSTRSPTGYRGVAWNGSAFQAKHYDDGVTTSLGTYGSAVDAAVAVARHVAGDVRTLADVQREAGHTEVVGCYTLLCSKKSSTGFLGVTQRQPGAPFVAQRIVGGVTSYLGSYGTAVEAAVAVAQHAAGDRVGKEAGGSSEVVEGHVLQRSRNSSTGYLGVRPYGDRFRAVWQGSEDGKPRGKPVQIGQYDTVVEAALARARYVAGDAGAKQRVTGMVAEPEVDGYSLHRSRASATGYKGVCSYRGRYVARVCVGGKDVQVGIYDAIEEAALARAKFVSALGPYGTDLEAAREAVEAPPLPPPHRRLSRGESNGVEPELCVGEVAPSELAVVAAARAEGGEADGGDSEGGEAERQQQQSQRQRQQQRPQQQQLQQQIAFNCCVEPCLTDAASPRANGVVGLTVSSEHANRCALFLQEQWRGGQMLLPSLADGGGAASARAGAAGRLTTIDGYGMYGKVLDTHDAELQKLNTLLLTPARLPLCRKELPGFLEMEREIVGWLRERLGVVADLVSSHCLRQSPRTLQATGFDVHQDDEEDASIEYTVVVKLTADAVDEAPSAMRVVGAARHFHYGPSAGASACFRARLHHASVEPSSPEEHLKIAFFFRVTDRDRRCAKRRRPSSDGGHAQGSAEVRAATRG